MGYRLHNFFRSSTSYRVRAALNFKGLDYEYLSYKLRDGEQRAQKFLDINPEGLVPALETPQGVLSQSLAIIEWLDETRPEPALLPVDPWARARVRSLAHLIALDIHPINNLRVLFYIRDHFDADEEQQAAWFRHWATSAFDALEHRLAAEPETGTFCHGDTPSLADLCLAGQVINNQRFDVPLSPYQNIQRIFGACMEIPAFEQASPQHQPDAG